ncbi:2-heptyl-3-hydroxy-4(1H)-quinolone dioxygenase [Paramyrothecium foliicola]|nr:2-heptyl-3-hydroxy-4(1H)-quinolone dioxygenase [Paramyrothecium foliicola]
MGPPRFKADTFPYTKTINGHEIAFTDYGFYHGGPAIVTFSGWNSDHRGWSYLTSYLMEHYRVISICFRGHGPNRDPVPDFGLDDHADDVLALLEVLGVDQFICLAASQSNWAAMRVAELAGRARVLAIMILSQPMAEPTPQYYGALAALQGRDTWRAATVSFFNGWLGETQNERIREQCLIAIGGFGHDTWARSGRTVEAAYKKWGSPLKRLELLTDPPLVRHVYMQPNGENYDALHRQFEQKHPGWFSFTRLEGTTHFPHIEQPEAVYTETLDLMDKALKRPATDQAI